MVDFFAALSARIANSPFYLPRYVFSPLFQLHLPAPPVDFIFALEVFLDELYLEPLYSVAQYQDAVLSDVQKQENQEEGCEEGTGQQNPLHERNHAEVRFRYQEKRVAVRFGGFTEDEKTSTVCALQQRRRGY